MGGRRETPIKVSSTTIPGVLEVELPLHADNRGWFMESYQEAKLSALGLPAFRIVQHNISFNRQVGTTRGIHAEPWEKFISLATGRIFAAIVDLRRGDGFGTVETFELVPGRALFIPRGVGNSYQTLEPDTVYSYLTNELWSSGASYTFVNLFDADLAIGWPIGRQHAIISEKDERHPSLRELRRGEES